MVAALCEFGRYLFIALFGTSFEHFSPTFRSEGMDAYWKLKDFFQPSTLFYMVTPMDTSSWTLLGHIFLGFLHEGDSVPDGSLC